MEYLHQAISEFETSTIISRWSDWDIGVTYTTEADANNLTDGAVAKYGNYYYRTITNDNTGNNPEDTLGTKWIRWDISNQNAMIDLRSTSESISDRVPDYLTTGVSQIVDISVYTVVLYDVASGSTGDGVIGTTYRAVIEQLASDLDLEDFTNETNWEVFLGDLIVTFPKRTIDTLAIGYYTCDTLRIELLDEVGTVVWSEEEDQTPNEDVIDYYSYMYSEYTLEVDRARVFKLPDTIGVTIRVTFTVETSTVTAKCGFLIADEAISMGDTLYGVDFSFNSYSTKTTDTLGITHVTKSGIQDVVDFETVIDSAIMATNKRKIRSIYDEVLAFIIDPSDPSRYDNLVTLGMIDSVSIVLSNPQVTTVAWSIQETI